MLPLEQREGKSTLMISNNTCLIVTSVGLYVKHLKESWHLKRRELIM